MSRVKGVTSDDLRHASYILNLALRNRINEKTLLQDTDPGIPFLDAEMASLSRVINKLHKEEHARYVRRIRRENTMNRLLYVGRYLGPPVMPTDLEDAMKVFLASATDNNPSLLTASKSIEP